jgi:hypothetical protein
MEDVLFDSIGSLVKSIEEHRVSELLQDPKGNVRAAAAASSLTQNADILVGIVKSLNLRNRSDEKEAADSELTSEVVETIFTSLHRWLNCRSLAARLPKLQTSRSSSIRSSSRQCLDASVLQGDEKDFYSYLAGDPWEDCDDLAAEDLMAFLVEGFREGASVRVDKAVGPMALKSAKITPRHSTETASTIAPSEGFTPGSSKSLPTTTRSLDSAGMLPTTNRSLDSDSCGSSSFGRPRKSSEHEEKKDVLDCGLSVTRRVVPVISMEERRKMGHLSSRGVPVRSAPSLGGASQSPVKKSFPGLLNPIVDVDTDASKDDKHLPAVAVPCSTWPRAGPAPKPAAPCYCISCLLGIDSCRNLPES